MWVLFATTCTGATSAGFTPSVANRVGQPTGLSYTDNVAAGTYFYRVTAEDAAGNVGPVSNEASATVGDTSAPSAPGTLGAVGSVGKATLSWGAATDNVGVARYNVHRGSSAGFTPSLANRIAQPTTTGYVDTTSPGSYFYKVTAEDAAGNVGPASNEAAATVTADTTAPSAPTGLSGAGDRQHRQPRLDRLAPTTSPSSATTSTAAPAPASPPAGEPDRATDRHQLRRTRASRPAATSTRSPPRTPPATPAPPRTRRRPPSPTRPRPARPAPSPPPPPAARSTSAGAPPQTTSPSPATTSTAAPPAASPPPPPTGSRNPPASATQTPASPPAPTSTSSPPKTPPATSAPSPTPPPPPSPTPPRPAPPPSTPAAAPAKPTSPGPPPPTTSPSARYNLHRSTTSGFTPTTANRIAQPTGTSHTDTGLAAGTYHYKLTAEDAAGNPSAASNQASATVTAPAVTGLVAAYGLDDRQRHHASPTNPAPATTAPSANTTWAGPRAGRYGNALTFNGTNAARHRPRRHLPRPHHRHDHRGLGPTHGAGEWHTVVFKERPGYYALRPLRERRARNRPTGERLHRDRPRARGTAQLPLNTWTHLAATYDGSVLALYVNGTQAGTLLVSGAIITSTGAAEDRRQRDLGRVVHRPHRRGPHLQPRTHRHRDPDRHEHGDHCAGHDSHRARPAR